MTAAIALRQTASPLVFVDDGGEAVLVHDGSPPEVMRERIRALANLLLALPKCEHRDMPVEHLIVDGMYLRKLFIPKGTLLVGKIHRRPCHNIVASGDISVLTEVAAGRFKSGSAAVSWAGTQKVGFAHEDTVFINVFRTDETDIGRIEAEIAAEEHIEAGAIGVQQGRELQCQLHG